MSLPDWKGLLKWSLSKTDPNSNDRNVKPMSKEDVAFLEGAMASVHEHEKELAECVVNINRISRQFKQENTHQPLENADKGVLVTSLAKLEEHFEEHPSNSSSLVRQGLLESFTLLLRCSDRDVLDAVLSIISCSFSNNESILEEAAQSQLLPNLLDLRSQLTGTDLEPRLITALSSSIRNCAKADQKFVALGGLGYLMDCLESQTLRTRERSVLLLTYFISLSRISREEVLKLNPYKIVKILLPLDPARDGIQFAELSCKLVMLLYKKHK